MSARFMPQDGLRELSCGEIEAEIEQLDFDRRSRMLRHAESLANNYAGEGRGLLQDAVFRALTLRTCRDGVTVKILGRIVQSVASPVRQSRDNRMADLISMRERRARAAIEADQKNM